MADGEAGLGFGVELREEEVEFVRSVFVVGGLVPVLWNGLALSLFVACLLF